MYIGILEKKMQPTKDDTDYMGIGWGLGLLGRVQSNLEAFPRIAGDLLSWARRDLARGFW